MISYHFRMAPGADIQWNVEKNMFFTMISYHFRMAPGADMYVCLCMHICVSAYTLYACIRACVFFICVSVWMCVCVYTCVRVCTHASTPMLCSLACGSAMRNICITVMSGINKHVFLIPMQSEWNSNASGEGLGTYFERLAAKSLHKACTRPAQGAAQGTFYLGVVPGENTRGRSIQEV